MSVANRNFFQMAIGTTVCGTLLVGSALVGCNLGKSDWSIVSCSPWSSTVVWSHVRLGAPFLILAVYFWRLALRSMEPRTANLNQNPEP
jgi:hypothetical protein